MGYYCFFENHLCPIYINFFNRLDSEGNIKVGDFGLAEDIYNCGYFRQERKENVRLPYKWMAVESLNDGIFSEHTDVVIYGS